MAEVRRPRSRLLLPTSPPMMRSSAASDAHVLPQRSAWDVRPYRPSVTVRVEHEPGSDDGKQPVGFIRGLGPIAKAGGYVERQTVWAISSPVYHIAVPRPHRSRREHPVPTGIPSQQPAQQAAHNARCGGHSGGRDDTSVVSCFRQRGNMVYQRLTSLHGSPGRPIHIVCAPVPAEARLIIITTYQPDPERWEPDFTWRKR